jgi:hypothetical protein
MQNFEKYKACFGVSECKDMETLFGMQSQNKTLSPTTKKTKRWTLFWCDI